MITITVSDDLLATYRDHNVDLWYSPPNGPAYWATDRQWSNDTWLTDADTLRLVLSDGGIDPIDEQVIGIEILKPTDLNEMARACWNNPDIDVIVVKIGSTTMVFGRIDKDGKRFTEDGTWVRADWSMELGWNTDDHTIATGIASWSNVVRRLNPER